MEIKALETPINGGYLLQLTVDGRERFRLHEREMMDAIRRSFADRVAEYLFEKVEPRLEQALKERIDG